MSHSKKDGDSGEQNSSLSITSGLAKTLPLQKSTQVLKQRCLLEIAEAQAYVAEHGPDFGAMLGLDDWFFELLLLRGEIDGGTASDPHGNSPAGGRG